MFKGLFRKASLRLSTVKPLLETLGPVGMMPFSASQFRSRIEPGYTIARDTRSSEAKLTQIPGLPDPNLLTQRPEISRPPRHAHVTPNRKALHEHRL